MKELHLYKDKSDSIHLCESSQIIPSDRGTYLVWTLCNKDVPANQSFKDKLEPTCAKCKNAVKWRANRK